MREKGKSFRREELELLSSAELNQMVRSELEKDSIDRDAVLQILRILEERDAEDPTLQKVDDTAAWEEFQTHFVAAEEGCSKSGHAHTCKKSIPWFAKTAVAAIIVFALLVVAPPAMGYENIFELVGRWTQDVFQLLSPTSATMSQTEHEFRTDHPGLRQLYDAVTELGVTQPVVPTWLPEGYELKEIKVSHMPVGSKIHARLEHESKVMVITYQTYNEDSSSKYEKNEYEASIYEIANVKHYVMPNENKWGVVWAAEQIECSIIVEEGEDILQRILHSIYWRSTNETVYTSFMRCHDFCYIWNDSFSSRRNDNKG